MPASNQNGTQTATISTEHTLGAAVTTAGTYLLAIDTTNMVAGDELELRVKNKVLTGGTEILQIIGQFANAQVEPYKITVPIVVLYSCSFTLKQVAGVGRNYDWNIVAL